MDFQVTVHCSQGQDFILSFEGQRIVGRTVYFLRHFHPNFEGAMAINDFRQTPFPTTPVLMDKRFLVSGKRS